MSKKKKKSVKKVTAPVTYNPGKGRPKEHLAYLNYQEMEALKRLNGNNQERGPKGLPSFPPAGAMSGNSAKSPASTSTAKAAGSAPRTTTTRSSGPSSSLNAPVRTQPSSNINRPSNSGGGGARDSGQAANRPSTTNINRPSSTGGGGAASVARISGGTPGSNARDAQVQKEVASRSTSSALKTPALRTDTARTAIGGISKDRSVGIADASRIRGAINSVKETASEAALMRQGPFGPAPQQYKTIADFNKAFAEDLAKKQFARTGYSPQEINKLAQGVYGEAAAEGYKGMNPVARSMVNSIAGGIDVPTYGYIGGSDFDTLAARYDVFKNPNEPFKSAGINSLNQTKGLFSLSQASGLDSAFSRSGEISDRVKDSTHYYAHNDVKPGWSDKSFERYGDHTFGTADAISERRIAAARDKVFGGEGMGTPVADATTVPRPRLRPDPPQAQTLMSTPAGKLITDRVPPTYPTISEDPTLPGKRTKQIYDRVTPGTDPVRAAMMSEIAAQSPSYFKLGANDERMLYNASPETEKRMRDVFRSPPSVGRSVVNPVRTPPNYARIASDPTQTPTSYPRISADPTRTPSNYARIASDPTESERILSVENLMSDAGIRKTVNPVTRTKQIRDRVYPSIPEPDSIGMLPPSQGGIMRGISALREYDLAAMEGLKTVSGYVAQHAKANKGGVGILNSGYGLFNNGVSASDQAVIDATRGALKSGAQKIASLQENYRKSIADAAKASPAPIEDGESEDISNGLATVSLAEGYKLGEGKKTRPMTNEESRMSSFYMINPTLNETLETEARPYSLTPEEREAMDAMYQASMLGEMQNYPKNVTPEAQKKMKRDETLNKIGTRIIKSRNPAAQVADGLLRLFTGKNSADTTAALKRQYMQSSPEQQAALERQYPNLTRFAVDVGLTPQLDMKNYTDWAQRAGLRGPTESSRDNERIMALADGLPIARETGNDNSGGGTGSSGGGTGGGSGSGSSNGRRPYIYYEWDLGVNIPSPGQPLYTMYTTYLAEREAAANAMYG
jgi:hypothetical protein